MPARARVLHVPGVLQEAGGTINLLVVALSRAARPPYSWGPEFAVQLRSTVRICLWPMVLTAFALSFGPVGVQATGVFQTLGALDRLGQVYQLTVVRMFAPLVVGLVLAGAAGAAFCADLGARVVREEINALRVLGVDDVRSLVAPRLLVIIVIAPLFNLFAILAGLLGLVVVSLQSGAGLEPVFSTFFSNATALELQASMVKATVYGLVIGAICCYQGISVSSGPESVGRAVNRSIVMAFLALGFIDYVFTQLLLATNPLLSQVRG